MTHDFSVDTPHVRFCSRCARPDTRKIRLAPCLPLSDVREVLARRLKILFMLLDAHTRSGVLRRVEKPNIAKLKREMGKK